jgi:hypothetical protein
MISRERTSQEPESMHEYLLGPEWETENLVLGTERRPGRLLEY